MKPLVCLILCLGLYLLGGIFRQAVEAGILTGVDDGQGGVTIARPRAHTTRQELATMGVAILKAARG